MHEAFVHWLATKETKRAANTPHRSNGCVRDAEALGDGGEGAAVHHLPRERVHEVSDLVRGPHHKRCTL
jgi:hypothetical protein